MRMVFIGTSLGNSFFATEAIGQGASVTFFEASHLGGAWGQAPLAGVDAPRFNNIVFPYDASQEEKIDRFFEWLVDRGASVDLVQENFEVSTLFKPAKIIAGNFAAPIVSVAESACSVVEREIVRNIDVYDSHVVVNGRDYDFAILPLNARLESVRFMSKDKGRAPEPLEWVSSTSEHLRALYDSPINGRVFAENKDNVFDRCGIVPGETNLFIGRVSKKWKGHPPDLLFANSSMMRTFGKSKLSFDFLKYEQQRMRPAHFERLRAKAIGSRLIILDSSDVISSIQNAEIALHAIFGPHFRV